MCVCVCVRAQHITQRTSGPAGSASGSFKGSPPQPLCPTELLDDHGIPLPRLLDLEDQARGRSPSSSRSWLTLASLGSEAISEWEDEPTAYTP